MLIFNPVILIRNSCHLFLYIIPSPAPIIPLIFFKSTSSIMKYTHNNLFTGD